MGHRECVSSYLVRSEQHAYGSHGSATSGDPRNSVVLAAVVIGFDSRSDARFRRKATSASCNTMAARATSARTKGSKSVLQEIFPIESYDKTLKLEYLRYELGKPRYTPDECRQLRLTYGQPFRVWLRLNKDQPIEEEVYLGDIPIMLGGGEFIINGAERVVVSQLHRSPGIDFVSEMEAADRRTAQLPHDSRARKLDRAQRHQKRQHDRPHRPERQVFGDDVAAGDGSRSMGLDADILAAFLSRRRKQKIVDGRSAAKIEGKIAVDDVVYPAGSDRAGEIIVEAGQQITKNIAEIDLHFGREERRGDGAARDAAFLNALADDNTSSHEEALLRIYQRLASRQSAAAGKGTDAVSRKNSSTPIVIAWVASAASASIASWSSMSPKRK